MMKAKCVLILLCVLLTSGCKTKYIYRDKVRTEYKNIVKTDTIMKQDSVYKEIFTNQYSKNDTIYIERIIYKYKYDKVKHVNNLDTVINITDTVTVQDTTGANRYDGGRFGGWIILILLVTIVASFLIFDKLNKK